MEPTLVVADLHADPGALDAVLRAVDDPGFRSEMGDLERVVNLGDVVGRGPDPAKLWSRLETLARAVETTWILGNHEEALLRDGRVLSGGTVVRRAHDAFSRDADVLGRMEALPEIARLEDVLCVHGGPVDPAKLAGDRLSRRTWQRIGERAYPADDGHRITPVMAFESLGREVGPDGLLLSGHEHRELLLVRDGGAPRPPDVDRIRLATAAGTVRGRTVRRRPGRALLARVGLGARREGEVRFGWLLGDEVHLLGLHV